MKGYILVDIPEDCEDCEQFDGRTGECTLLGQYYRLGEYTDNCRSLMEDGKCPIKPIPMKRRSMVNWLHEDIQTAISTHEISEYDKGWNDCVEYLEGEDYE